MNWLENFGGSIDLETKIKYKECIGGFDQDLEHSISKMIKVITNAEKKSWCLKGWYWLRIKVLPVQFFF